MPTDPVALTLESLHLAILATRQAIAAETGGPFVRLALVGTETVLLRRVAEIRRAMEEAAIAAAGAVAGEAPPARPLPTIVYARPPRRRR